MNRGRGRGLRKSSGLSQHQHQHLVHQDLINNNQLEENLDSDKDKGRNEWSWNQNHGDSNEDLDLGVQDAARTVPVISVATPPELPLPQINTPAPVVDADTSMDTANFLQLSFDHHSPEDVMELMELQESQDTPTQLENDAKTGPTRKTRAGLIKSGKERKPGARLPTVTRIGRVCRLPNYFVASRSPQTRLRLGSSCLDESRASANPTDTTTRFKGFSTSSRRGYLRKRGQRRVKRAGGRIHICPTCKRGFASFEKFFKHYSNGKIRCRPPSPQSSLVSKKFVKSFEVNEVNDDHLKLPILTIMQVQVGEASNPDIEQQKTETLGYQDEKQEGEEEGMVECNQWSATISESSDSQKHEDEEKELIAYDGINDNDIAGDLHTLLLLEAQHHSSNSESEAETSEASGETIDPSLALASEPGSSSSATASTSMSMSTPNESTTTMTMSPRPANDAKQDNDSDLEIVEVIRAIKKEEGQNNECEEELEEEDEEEFGAGDQYLFHLIMVAEKAKVNSANLDDTRKASKKTDSTPTRPTPVSKGENNADDVEVEQENGEMMRVEDENDQNLYRGVIPIPGHGLAGSSRSSIKSKPESNAHDGRELDLVHISEEQRQINAWRGLLEGIMTVTIITIPDESADNMSVPSLPGPSDSFGEKKQKQKLENAEKAGKINQPRRRSENESESTQTSSKCKERGKAKKKNVEIMIDVNNVKVENCTLSKRLDLNQEADDNKESQEMMWSNCERKDLDMGINEEFPSNGASHEGPKLRCEYEYCDYGASNRIGLWEHYSVEHHESGPWICEACHGSFDTTEDLRLHSKTCHP